MNADKSDFDDPLILIDGVNNLVLIDMQAVKLFKRWRQLFSRIGIRRYEKGLKRLLDALAAIFWTFWVNLPSNWLR